MDHTIVVSTESYLEDIQVGYLFLSKKDLMKKLFIFAIRKTFQQRVDRSNKKSICCKMRNFDMFKVSKYMLVIRHAKRFYESRIISKPKVG